nr:hypothetical protein [Tanacetum cinerariifolium]
MREVPSLVAMALTPSSLKAVTDSGGRKNNHRKKTNTNTCTGSVTESDEILNDATLLVDASVAKEVVSPSMVDKTVSMVKLSSLEDTTVLGSFPPLPTQKIGKVALDLEETQEPIIKSSDTTMVTTEWEIYELAKTPKMKDIQSVCGSDKITEENLSQLPNLSANFHETLRRHNPIPIFPFGGVKRVCAGSLQAVLTFCIGIGGMVQEFDWSFKDKAEEDISTLGLTTQRLNPLHAIIKPRN